MGRDLKVKLQEQAFEADNMIAEVERVVARMKSAFKFKTKPETPEKVAKLQAAESMLAELMVSRQQVDEDLRYKSAALRIEQACLMMSAGKVETRSPAQRQRLS